MDGRRRRLLVTLATAAALLAGTTVITAPAPAAAALTAPEIRGVNWADGRDNFVCGDLVPTGLWSSDGYATVYAKASSLYGQFVALTGANTVRLPVNVDTVAGSWWAAYAAAVDAAVDAGLNVILAEWDQCDSRDGRLDPGWEGLWDRVIARYGTDDHVLFEIMNEPFGYTAAGWLDTAAAWIARYDAVPRGRIIVAGPGYDDNAYTAGRDPRFDGTLLAIHHYAFWQDPLSYAAWRSQTRDRVAEFADRTVFTEYGTFMTTGLDFDDTSASAVNEIRYLRGVTDEFAALGVGSVYWPGLRSGDAYSLTAISGDSPGGSGSAITMRVTNESGLRRVRHGWRADGAVPTTTTTISSTTTTSTTSGSGSATTALVGVQSGRCVDVPAGSATNGTRVTLYTCNGGANQRWTYTAAQEFRSLGKCLDVVGQGRTPGTDVALYDCNGGANQRWTLGSDGSIVGVQSGLCLDVYGQATGDGARIDVWTCNGGANQRWTRR